MTRREELAGLCFVGSMLALLASVVAQSMALCLAGLGLYAAACLMDGLRG